MVFDNLNKAIVTITAPLSRWTIEDSFSTVDQCRDRIARDYAVAKNTERSVQKFDNEQRELARKGDSAAKQWIEDDAKAAPLHSLKYTGTVAPRDPDVVPGICIASADPRLNAR